MAITTEHTIIAREGQPFIWLAIIVAVAASYYFGVIPSLPVWALPLILIFLFRDPSRHIPPDPLGVLSPVDARITAIEEVRDGFLDRDAIKISFLMGFFDIYTVRSPVEGKIMHQWIVDSHVAVSDAPRFAQWVQTDEEDDVLLAMYKSFLPIRPRCYAQSGERIGQGQRCGYMSFGARLEIFVPANSRIDVEVGQHVRAGEDVLAHLVHAGR